MNFDTFSKKYYLNSTNYKNRNFNPNDSLYFNLTGGMYIIPNNLTTQFLKSLYNQLLITPVLPITPCVDQTIVNLPNYPLTFDIDSVKMEIHQIIDNIDKILTRFFIEPDLKKIILQRSSGEKKYHIYYPNIFITNDISYTLYKMCNETYGKNFCDNLQRKSLRVPLSLKNFQLEGSDYVNDDLTMDMFIGELNLHRSSKSITPLNPTITIEKINKKLKKKQYNKSNRQQIDFKDFKYPKNPEIESILKVNKILNYERDEKCIYFQSDLCCPFTHKKHKSFPWFSTKFVLNTENDELYKFCTDKDDCGHHQPIKMYPKFEKCLIDDDEDDEENTQNLLDDTDWTIGEWFEKFYGKKWIYNGNNFYYFSKKLGFWVYDEEERHLKKMISTHLYKKLDTEITNRMFDEPENDYWTKLKGKMTCIRNEKKKNNIISTLTTILYQDVKFNQNPYVIVFSKGIYDFKLDKFRMSKSTEYISNERNTGYEYQDLNEEKMEFLRNYLNKTFLNKEENQVYFRFLSTSLLGKSVKQFCINNGSSNNNKSRFHEFLSKMLGNYSVKINVKNITEKVDNAECHKKLHQSRHVYVEEPKPEDIIDGCLLKDWVGASGTSIRKFYSDKSDIDLHMTFFLNCNKRPRISPIDEAIKNRLIDFEYRATFTDSDIDNITRFPKDSYFESEEFYDTYKIELFHFLKEYTLRFIDEGEKITLNESLKNRRDQYLRDCDEIYEWFFDTFEEHMGSITKFREISTLYKDSLGRKERRDFRKKNFEDEVLSRSCIKKYHREIYRFNSNGKQMTIRNCFVNIRKKVVYYGIDDDDLNDGYEGE